MIMEINGKHGVNFVKLHVDKVAISPNWLSLIVKKENGKFVVYLKKSKLIFEVGCGQKHNIVICIDHYFKGGFLVDNFEKKDDYYFLEKELIHDIYKIKLHQVYYHKILNSGYCETTFFDYSKYLIFKKADNEYKLINENFNNAFIIDMYTYTVYDDEIEADIKVINIKGELEYSIFKTSCKKESIASLFVVGKAGSKIKIQMTQSTGIENEKVLQLTTGGLKETLFFDENEIDIF